MDDVKSFLDVRNDLTGYFKYHYPQVRDAAKKQASDSEDEHVAFDIDPTAGDYQPYLDEDNELSDYAVLERGADSPIVAPESVERSLIFKYEVRGGPSIREGIGPNYRVQVFGYQRLRMFAALNAGVDELEAAASAARHIFEGRAEQEWKVYPTLTPDISPEWRRRPSYIQYEPAEYEPYGLLQDDKWFLGVLTARFSYFNIYNTPPTQPER